MRPERKWLQIRHAAKKLTGLEWFGLIWTLIFIILMFIGPLIAPHPTESFNPDITLLPPSLSHPFGTDENGMDIFSRIVAAPRVDVSVGMVTAILAVLIGIPLGVLAGFFEGSERRWLSLLGQVILRLLDVLQSIPVFILAMILVAVRGPAIENIIFAITFVNVPLFLRLSRSEMLSLRERLFAEAARASGNSDLRIAFRHLLPNALASLMNQVSVTVGFAILLAAGLSFVGAGIAPPTPELGAMVSSGAKYTLLGFWWVGLFPGIFLGLIVFVFAVSGEILNHLLAPGALRVEAKENNFEIESLPPFSNSRENVVIASGKSNGYQDILVERQNAERELDLLKVNGLTVKSINKESKKTILENVTFSIKDGEILGVIGESGSGKSILVKSILLLPPDGLEISDGDIYFSGQDLRRLTKTELVKHRGTDIAALLPGARQQLNPVIKVGEMMAAALQAHIKISKAEALERSIRALEAVNIPDPIRRIQAYPHELSGGMAQRVCIAISLLHNPRLLIADEPTAGLDVTVTRQVLDLMKELSRDRGMAQLIVTRDLGIVAQYCHRIAVMKKGKIIEIGPVSEVFNNPKEPYTKRLVSSELPNIQEVELEV